MAHLANPLKTVQEDVWLLVLQVALRLNNRMSNKSVLEPIQRMSTEAPAEGSGAEGISNVGQARGDQTQTGSATEHSQQHTSDSETQRGSELDDENAFA